MTRLKDASLRVKLFGGFGVVLALMVVLGVVLLTQLSSVNAGGRTIGSNSLPSVKKIEAVATNVATARMEANRVMVIDSDARIKTLIKQRAITVAQINQTLSGYGPDAYPGPDENTWHAVQRRYAAYANLMASLLPVALSHDHARQAAFLDRTDGPFQAVQSEVAKWGQINSRIAAAQVRSNASTYDRARAIGLVLMGVALIIGLLLAFVISRSIKRAADVVLDRVRSLTTNCVSFITEGIEALAEGDLTRSFTPMTAKIDNPAGDEIGQIGSTLNEAIDKVSGALLAYNRTAEQLREVMGRVSSTAGDVGSSSSQMASTSQEAGRATGEIASAVGDVAQGAERQVALVSAARQSAEEVARAVADSAEHAAGTAEAAHAARQVAEEGVAAAEEATEAMRSVRDSSLQVPDAIRELAGKSERIGAIVHTISGIAEQTNLLALNAAIEAARAGEQGKGFAVVAEEVRKLAEESQEAAEEISGLIGAIQQDTAKAVTVVQDSSERTEQGTTVVTRTREAFQRIGDSVSDISGRVEQIAAAAEQIAASAETMQESITEVASVAEQSSASTEQVSASTEQTSASTQQVAASAQQLAGSAEELNQLVARFKVAA